MKKQPSRTDRKPAPPNAVQLAAAREQEDANKDTFCDVFALREGAKRLFRDAVKAHDEAGDAYNKHARDACLLRVQHRIDEAQRLLRMATEKLEDFFCARA